MTFIIVIRLKIGIPNGVAVLQVISRELGFGIQSKNDAVPDNWRSNKPKFVIGACTDISDGGIALAAFELAEAAGVGVQLDSDATPLLFGEDQARYLVACNFDQAEALMGAAHAAGVPISGIGRFTGSTVRMGASEAPLEDLAVLYRSSFAAALG